MPPRFWENSDARYRSITIMRTLLFCIIGLLLVAAPASPQALVGYQRSEDVVYGRKCGTALTLDVFEPEKKNGCAIFFMVSGRFFSSHAAITPKTFYPLLERGYTVFAVVHGSQPRFV